MVLPLFSQLILPPVAPGPGASDAVEHSGWKVLDGKYCDVLDRSARERCELGCVLSSQGGVRQSSEGSNWRGNLPPVRNRSVLQSGGLGPEELGGGHGRLGRCLAE